jgi:hypothetical protein
MAFRSARRRKLARDVARLQAGSLRFKGPRFWRRHRYRSLLASIGRSDHAALDQHVREAETRPVAMPSPDAAGALRGSRSDPSHQAKRSAA